MQLFLVLNSKKIYMREEKKSKLPHLIHGSLQLFDKIKRAPPTRHIKTNVYYSATPFTRSTVAPHGFGS